MPKYLLNTPTEAIVEEINRLGLSGYVKKQHREGRKVSAPTLSRWLRRNGYKSRPQYIKESAA